MFSKGMERITGECNPKLYESILTNNTLDASDIEKLINVLFISEYDVRRILELKECLSARGVAEYACSFVDSIDLKENLNLFCIRNEVPEVARVYIIDKNNCPCKRNNEYINLRNGDMDTYELFRFYARIN